MPYVLTPTGRKLFDWKLYDSEKSLTAIIRFFIHWKFGGLIWRVKMEVENLSSAIKNPAVYIEEVYTDNYTGLRNLAIKRGCQIDEAEDIAQTAISNFIAYMEKRNWTEKVEKPFSFLARSVCNLIIDKARREKLENSVSLDDKDNLLQPSDNGSAAAVIDLKIDERERFEKELKPLMEGFSEYEEELVWLKIIKKYKPRDIADILNQSYEKTSIDCNRLKSKLRGRAKSNAMNM